MRLGKDVLEADLYGVLGVLPDATESELRVAYRRQARVSHPDLNRADPEAPARMKQLNLAARVLLDTALRRSYDRGRRSAHAPGGAASTKPVPAWYERREQHSDDAWVSSPGAAPRELRSGFGELMHQLRSREARLSLHVQELVESLSARQQLGVTALLFAGALCLIAIARPAGLFDDRAQPTTVNLDLLPP